MSSYNAPQSKVRRFYISDPAKINEQECYNQGLQHLAKGDEDEFEVHWHTYMNGCPCQSPLRIGRHDKKCYRVLSTGEV